MSAVSKPEPKSAYDCFQRLEKVVKNVGISNLEAFNKWAFKQHPMRYDDSLIFLWQNTHSTKAIDGEADEMLDKICDLWKARNAEWPPIEFGD